ncbi:SpaA isopeptide-forming pilin-related protein [Companilactobacillus muriivasis]|uniref:SpaA isopeptide-forming pilin-related protein n=1 Tax=Companilactobacillus muriivasis TaxID=3081444 RepID=UPI0030C724F8
MKVDENGKSYILVTFDNVDGKTDYEGSLNIKKGIGPGPGASLGNNDVNIGNNHSDNMTVTKPDADFSKKGTLGTDADGNHIITWSILVNRNSETFNKLTIHESIQAGQEYVPGSLAVYTAAWKPDNPGYYTKSKNPISGYTVTPNESEITTDFVISQLPDPNQFYVVTFQTKISEKDATSGDKIRNDAHFTWSDGSGDNGGLNTGDASASVSGGSNSGNGNGVDIKGGVVLTKLNANDDDENSPIAGAVYTLYKEDGTIVKEGLTTDDKGQISVDNLEKGNYYFLETTPPAGFEPNGNQVPFTISGKSSEAVSVTTKDEPETDIDADKEGSIVLMKKDDTTDYRLAGAEYTVKDSDGNVVGTITTDSMGIGHLYNLKQGTYTIQETKAPAGYLESNEIQTVTIGPDDLTPALITFENEKDEDLIFDDSYEVNLQKFDRHDMKTGVPGATYALYSTDDNKNPIGTYVTDKDGLIKVDGLKPGDYYFIETIPPTGYEINNDPINFTIESGQQNTLTHETSDPRTEGNGGDGGTDPDIDDKDDEDEDDNGGNTTDPDIDDKDDEDEDDNGGNTTDPDVDENGNENNGGNEDGNNGGGIVVDPENPGSNNNGNNNNGGVITNPGNNSNSNSNSNGTLPQTGAKSGIAVSLLGLVVLLGTVYFKRRHA